MRRTVKYYFTISVHWKSNLIRVVAIAGSGLVRILNKNIEFKKPTVNLSIATIIGGSGLIRILNLVASQNSI